MLGEGKYAAECDAALKATQAKGLIIMVFDGYAGNGFSAHVSPAYLRGLPSVLREVAAQIEADLPEEMKRINNMTDEERKKYER